MSLYAGFGKSEITPPPDSGGEMDLRILSFWYDRAIRYAEVRDPLFARAAAFRSGGETVCIVALDLIGDSVGFAAGIRERLAETSGLPPERVMVACTHPHATPETIALTDHPVHPRWIERVCEHAADAARQAVVNLAPCDVVMGEGRLPGIAYNRAARPGGLWETSLSEADRARHALLDETVRVATFRGEGGAMLGALFSFACHPVCVQAQPFISADWLGFALRRLEGRFPSVFLNGACGDADPVRMKSYDAARWVGDNVARKVEEVLSNLDGRPGADDVTIRAARRVVALRRRPVRPLARLEDEIRQLEAAAANAAPPVPGGADNALHERLFDLREEAALARLSETLEGEVQAIRVGPILFAGISGEVVACLGDDVRRALPGRNVWVVGYANGYVGYCVPAASYAAEGYEASVGRWARLAPGEGERLRDEAIALAQSLETAG